MRVPRRHRPLCRGPPARPGRRCRALGARSRRRWPAAAGQPAAGRPAGPAGARFRGAAHLARCRAGSSPGPGTGASGRAPRRLRRGPRGLPGGATGAGRGRAAGGHGPRPGLASPTPRPPRPGGGAGTRRPWAGPCGAPTLSWSPPSRCRAAWSPRAPAAGGGHPRRSDHLPPPDRPGAERAAGGPGVHGPYLLARRHPRAAQEPGPPGRPPTARPGPRCPPWPLVVVGPTGWGSRGRSVGGSGVADGVVARRAGAPTRGPRRPLRRGPAARLRPPRSRATGCPRWRP